MKYSISATDNPKCDSCVAGTLWKMSVEEGGMLRRGDVIDGNNNCREIANHRITISWVRRRERPAIDFYFFCCCRAGLVDRCCTVTNTTVY